MNYEGAIATAVFSVCLLMCVACGGGNATDIPVETPLAFHTTKTPIPTITMLSSRTPISTVAEDKYTPTVTPAPTGTYKPAYDLVAKGKELYLTPPPNVGPQALWCYQCHTIEGISNGLVGPDHTNVGTWAATRKPGLSAEEYIRESIRTPEVFVTEGVERAIAGLMGAAITVGLTDDQIDALVDFLAGRK